MSLSSRESTSSSDVSDEESSESSSESSTDESTSSSISTDESSLEDESLADIWELTSDEESSSEDDPSIEINSPRVNESFSELPAEILFSIASFSQEGYRLLFPLTTGQYKRLEEYWEDYVHANFTKSPMLKLNESYQDYYKRIIRELNLSLPLSGVFHVASLSYKDKVLLLEIAIKFNLEVLVKKLITALLKEISLIDSVINKCKSWLESRGVHPGEKKLEIINLSLDREDLPEDMRHDLLLIANLPQEIFLIDKYNAWFESLGVYPGEKKLEIIKCLLDMIKDLKEDIRRNLLCSALLSLLRSKNTQSGEAFALLFCALPMVDKERLVYDIMTDLTVASSLKEKSELEKLLLRVVSLACFGAALTDVKCILDIYPTDKRDQFIEDTIIFSPFLDPIPIPSRFANASLVLISNLTPEKGRAIALQVREAVAVFCKGGFKELTSIPGLSLGFK